MHIDLDINSCLVRINGGDRPETHAFYTTSLDRIVCCVSDVFRDYLWRCG